MNDKMHFFTSITNNYLPKARILAKSLKKHRPNARFSVLLCDELPEEINITDEAFDDVYSIDELGVPVDNLQAWIFMHTVVELCTAVKGAGLVKFLEEGSQKVVYLDPDIAVFSDLTQLEDLLDEHSVVITPHLCEPEEKEIDIILNEVSCLRHGIYNFGFFAVNNCEEGMRFAHWWRDRLVNFCYDDIPNGIFTDQRWADFIPAYFANSYVLRCPQYNVSTWNLTHRLVEKTKDGGYTVNGQPLEFYHFSGFDSGGQENMLKLYGENNEALWELREWYIKRMGEEEQEKYGEMPCVYAKYDSGEEITKHQRFLLRHRTDVQNYLDGADPFEIGAERSYYEWYMKMQDHAPNSRLPAANYLEQEEKIKQLQAVIDNMKASRSWRWTAWMRRK